MNRFVKLETLIISLTIIFNGCSYSLKTLNDDILDQSDTLAKTNEILFLHNFNGVPKETLEKLCDEFTNETNIKINISAPESSYEETMKTRMASNDLPDIWSTHGWSLKRYKDYLRPLNDQPFTENIVDSIKSIVTDDMGNIYTLPLNVDLAGIIYNEAVIAKSGVNIESIKTWNDFEMACFAIKEAGFIPIYIGGKDNWMISQYFDYAAPSFYLIENDYSDQFLDGSFDFQNWSYISEMLYNWNNLGYINEDSLFRNYEEGKLLLAENKVGFMFTGSAVNSDVIKLNPDAKIGLMPIPSFNENEQLFLSGEAVALGVWNESQFIDESLLLLNYFAKPEFCSRISRATALPAGLKNVESDIGNIKKYYDKYSHIKSYSYFDREYLPNGMWDIMAEVGAILLSKKENAVSESILKIQEGFNELKGGY